jgi:hypothetical protein
MSSAWLEVILISQISQTAAPEELRLPTAGSNPARRADSHAKYKSFSTGMIPVSRASR